jgi:hypothetical protein
MKMDGIQLIEGSSITNLTVKSGVNFPIIPDLGELFYKINEGLYVYDGNDWVSFALNNNSSITDVLTITGQLNGPANFIIDPAAVGDNTGVVIIKGDLQVDGNTTTINSNSLTITDKNIILSNGATNNSEADGSGITIAGANAALVYNASGDKFVVNKSLELIADPNTALGVATKQYVDNNTTPSSHITDETKHLTSAQNTWIDAITATATEVNYLSGTTSSVQNQLDNKQPLDGDLTSIAALAGTSGLARKTAANTWALDTNTYLTGNQSISFTGDATGSGTTSVALTLANVGTPGTYRSITTDAKGRVTAGTNPTTLAGYGITDAAPSSHLTDDTRHLTTAQNTWIDAITATSTEVNYISGTTSSVQNQLNSKLNLSGGTLTGNIVVPTGSHISIADAPTNGLHAANKNYIDAHLAGLSWKNSVIVATTANITLSGTQTIDGVAVVAGNRVLVKNQSTLSQNGIYLVAAGAWTRAIDMDATTPINELNSATVFVEQGTSNQDTGWTQINNIVTLGTDPVQFTQFNGADGVTAGVGLSKTGNQLDVNLGAGISQLPTDEVGIDVLSGGGLMTTVDGSTSSTLTNAQLALTNVGTAGTYRSVTTDAKGRVTAGTNPTTLAGYGITDAAPSSHLTDDTRHLTSAQNTWIDAITATSTEINYLSGTTSSIQNQLDSKFAKTGGTISGNVAIYTTGNASLEIGNINGVSASTPYLDFHSGLTAVDYDSRIIASGGTGASGQGAISIIAGGGLTVDGTITATNALVINANTTSNAVRISQSGTGNALVVEDQANPDSTPFVIDTGGFVVAGHTSSLTLGGATPLVQTHRAGTTSGYTASKWGADTGGPIVNLFKSRATTITGSGIVLDGDVLGSIQFAADNGVNYDSRGADIFGIITGTPSASSMPTSLIFRTTDGGQTSPVERFRISPSGSIGIGNGAVNNTIGVNIFRNATGGTLTRGVSLNNTILSDSTTQYNGFITSISTQAATFNIGQIRHFEAGFNTQGAGSTIGAQFGFLSSGGLVQATNNYSFYANNTEAVTAGKTSYGFYSAINTATGGGTTFAFFANGTAPSQFNGAVTVNNTLTATTINTANSGITAVNASTTTTAANQVIDTVSILTHRSVKYSIQITSGSSYHFTEVTLIHNGTTVFMNEYGTIQTNSSLATFDSDISGNNMRLLITPTNAVNAIKIVKTTIIL